MSRVGGPKGVSEVDYSSGIGSGMLHVPPGMLRCYGGVRLYTFLLVFVCIGMRMLPRWLVRARFTVAGDITSWAADRFHCADAKHG